MSKNDLTAFRRKPTPTPVLTETPPPKKAVGAPKKSEKEKLTERVQGLLTKEELAKFEAARGAVPQSTFLRIALKNAGII